MSIANFAFHFNGFLMKIGRTLVLTERVIRISQIPQRNRFAVSITNFACNFIILLMKVDRELVLTERLIHISQIS